jgi:hypothetical protein
MLLAGKGVRGKAAGLAPPQHTVNPERGQRSESAASDMNCRL